MVLDKANTEKHTTYLKNFISKNSIVSKEADVYENLISKLEKYPKCITEWDNRDFGTFIKNLNSISVNTIVKYSQYVKNFYEYVCRQENIKPKNLFLVKGFKHYINYEKLFATILNEDQYKLLKNILVNDVQGVEYNTRDKLLIELAWEGGLTVDEIKSLKYSDIEFNKIQNKPIAKLHLTDRTVVIYDEETIRDIQKTWQQKEYYLVSKVGKKDQIRPLKDTAFLIRAVKTNVSNADMVNNLGQMLKKILEKVYVLPDVDLDSLTLESIRRSKAIHLFKNNVSLDDVKEFMGKRTDCDLYWLLELANMIKNIEKIV